jgi:hypothetical protein
VNKHDNDDTERDVEKLTGLTVLGGEYAYRHGIHLVFDCSHSIVPNAIVYTEGRIDPVSLWLKFRLFGPETRALLESHGGVSPSD